MNSKTSNTQLGIAGEYFVAAELSRRGYIASITLKNTKGIDILVTNETGTNNLAIQVKTNNNASRSWILNSKNEDFISDNLFYIFVSLKSDDYRSLPEYYIVPSNIVANYIKNNHQRWLDAPGRNGQPHNDTSMRKFDINENAEEYLNKWDLIDLKK